VKGVAGNSERDTKIVRAVCRWFEAEARPLPWRAGKRGRGGAVRDPYLSLVSEFMLQQTQVSRVLEKWGAFVGQFPTVESLAAADDRQVMALWSGMGYYRRARNLHAAAREVVERFGGRVPSGVVDLQTLPGVGEVHGGSDRLDGVRQGGAFGGWERGSRAGAGGREGTGG
jgi:A/G-specific adenine glycosylase